MSSKIIASTSSGTALNMSADTSGILEIQTGATPTTAITVDASQNVGVGTASPGAKLEVTGAVRSLRTGSTAAVLQVINDNNSWNITCGTTTSQFRIDNNLVGTALTIDASNNVGIGTSSATYANGGGLTVYNATASRIKLGDVNSGVGSLDGFEIIYANEAYVFNRENTALVFGTNNTERMRIDPSGVLWIGGSTAASGAMTLARGGAGGGCIQVFNKPNSGATNVILNYYGATYVGGMNMDNTSTSFLTSSDVRLKENIVNASSSLDSINAIKIRSFDWKNDGSHQNYGVIAQELIDVASECVSRGAKEEDTWGVDYSKLVPRMIKAIQEQQALITDLTTRLAALEGAK